MPDIHVMIIGAAGMIGRKLAERLAVDHELANRPIDRLTLVDVFEPFAVENFRGQVDYRICDFSVDGAASELINLKPDFIFHLAAIVSGEAEADFEKGFRINMDGTRKLFEAIRLAEGDYFPRVIFTSSLAVFGAPLPDRIGDEFCTTPLTSYGTQKVICELLISEYSRRGFFDGIGIRLPTVCIRPGKPNKAVSGFFSGILREPLVGREAVLPVPEDLRHCFVSPRAAVGFLLHAAAINTALLGARRNLSMPALSVTVGEEIEALRRVAGDQAVKLIRHEVDPAITRIISGWPQAFDARRAEGLGFMADPSFEEIIRVHIEDNGLYMRG
jgi:D-erythronate 2-dehydrogenase